MDAVVFNVRTARLATFAALSITLVSALAIGVSPRDMARASETATEDDTMEIYRLADRSNLRRLDNGDFLFRLSRDRRTGIVYWAYMGSTRHVIAVAPDRSAFAGDAAARAVLLRIADIPRRVGCGIGLIHRSWVYVVPESAEFGASGIAPTVRPVFVQGEVRNDVSGRTPISLLSYRNFVTGG